jgi:hypothetical protein
MAIKDISTLEKRNYGKIRSKPSVYGENCWRDPSKYIRDEPDDVLKLFGQKMIESPQLIFFGSKFPFSENKDKIVDLTNEESISVSSELNPLIEAVEESKYILELPDNWDEEGSESYSKEVWVKAVKFLIRHAEWVLEQTGKPIVTPKILHGPDGSIDIYWKKPEFYLLINIPKEDGSLATFYVNNYKELKIEGQFNPIETLHYLLPPLI